jgi:hypothetical protein
VSEYTLDERLAYAEEKLTAALAAQQRANKLYDDAHEMGGGIPGFGGSGSQRAAGQVRGALDRAFRAQNDADASVRHWEQKKRSYELRIAERDRVRLTRADLVGATWVRDGAGWHRVARLNAKSVSVESGYSWTDRIEFDRILQVLRPEIRAADERPTR